MFLTSQYKTVTVYPMARPREFNEDEALDRAMEVFWKKGYQKTSLDDLLEGMGIQRGSFYNTFGSKRKTYLRALRRYVEVLPTLELYTSGAEEEPGLPRLRKMLAFYLSSVVGGDGPHGCLFNHASKEHRGQDPEVQTILMQGVAKVLQGIQGRLDEAQRAGQLPESLDSHDAAILFMSVAWGLHALAEAGLLRDELMAGAAQLFSLSQNTA